jgi:hypothetical protein
VVSGDLVALEALAVGAASLPVPGCVLSGFIPVYITTTVRNPASLYPVLLRMSRACSLYPVLLRMNDEVKRAPMLMASADGGATNPGAVPP